MNLNYLKLENNSNFLEMNACKIFSVGFLDFQLTKCSLHF